MNYNLMPTNNQIHFKLDLDLFSIPLFGQGAITYLNDGFIGLSHCIRMSLFDWIVLAQVCRKI